jgi:hypothetical protein
MPNTPRARAAGPAGARDPAMVSAAAVRRKGRPRLAHAAETGRRVIIRLQSLIQLAGSTTICPSIAQKSEAGDP